MKPVKLSLCRGTVVHFGRPSSEPQALCNPDVTVEWRVLPQATPVTCKTCLKALRCKGWQDHAGGYRIQNGLVRWDLQYGHKNWVLTNDEGFRATFSTANAGFHYVTNYIHLIRKTS